jgi:hypothetical protein
MRVFVFTTDISDAILIAAIVSPCTLTFLISSSMHVTIYLQTNSGINALQIKKEEVGSGHSALLVMTVER